MGHGCLCKNQSNKMAHKYVSLINLQGPLREKAFSQYSVTVPYAEIDTVYSYSCIRWFPNENTQWFLMEFLSHDLQSLTDACAEDGITIMMHVCYTDVLTF